MGLGRRLDRLYYEIDAETKGFDDAILQSGAKLKTFTEYAKGHPVAVLGALGAAAAAAAYKISQMGAAFQSEMIKVKTVVASSGGDMRALSDGVLRLFRSLPVESTKELSQALYDITSSGIAAGEALEFLGVTSRTAIAGFTSVDVATDALLTTFKAYESQGLTVAQVADKMAKAVDIGRGEFQDYAASMGSVAGIAATLGIPLDDLLGVVVQLSLNGIKAAEGMTAVRSALANIIRPNEKLKNDFPQLAEQFDLAALKSKGLTKFLVDLGEATRGNEKALNAVIPDIQGFTGVLTALKDGGEGAAKATQALADSQGAVDAKFRIATEGIEAQSKVLKNELIASLIELGTQVLPTVNYGLKVMSGFIEALTGRQQDLTQNAGAVTTITTLAAALDKLNPKRREEEIRRLEQAVRQLGGTGFGTLFDPARIDQLTNDQLVALQRGMARLLEEYPRMAADLRATAARNMQAVGVELLQRGALNPDVPGRKPPPGGAGGNSGSGLTSEELKQLKARQDAMVAAARDALVRGTKTMRDDLQLELDRMLKDAEESFVKFGRTVPPEVARAIEALRDRLAGVPFIEGLEDDFKRLAEKSAEASDFFASGYSDAAVQLHHDLSALVADTQARLDLTKADTDEHRRLKKLLEEILALRAKIAGQVANASEGTADQAKDAEAQMRALREMAHTIESSARGALQLAEAFGLVDARTASALTNVVQIAANLPALSGALQALGSGGSFASVATAALPVVGGIAALVGGILGAQSARDAETKRIQKANTETLRELTDVLGEFGLAITGNDFTKGLTAGNAALGALQSGAVPFSYVEKAVDIAKRLDANMQGLGVSMDDLRKLAGQLGLTLDERTPATFIESLQRVVEAIRQVQLTQFAHTFEGQLQSLNAQFKLFDISDPIAQLKELVKVFSSPEFGAPALRDALAGLDLSTPEGRAAAEAAIQQLFLALQNGTLDPAALDALTPQQFLDQLLNVKALLDDGQAAAGDTGTGGYNVDRTITEATGSHIAGLLVSANIYAARTAEAVEGMLRALLGGALPAITPPALPAGSGGYLAGGASVVVQVFVGAGGSLVDAERAGASIGTAVVDAIDRRLGVKVRVARQMRGDVTLPS